MRDKRNRQDITDVAWGKMEAILEKEMPQKKDRNRYFIWMFFGALLLTTIGAGLYFNNERSDSTLEESISNITKLNNSEVSEKLPTKSFEKEALTSTQSSKKQTSVAMVPSKKELPLNPESISRPSVISERKSTIKPIEQVNIATNTPEKKPSPNNISKVDKTPISIAQKETVEASRSMKNNLPKDKSYTSASPVKNTEFQTNIRLDERAGDAKNPLETNSKIGEHSDQEILNGKEEFRTENESKIDFLPELPIPFLIKPSSKAFEGFNIPEINRPAATTVVKAKSKLKLLPGIYAGAHFNPVFNFGGYEFGLTLTAPLSERFSITTGLGIADLDKKGFQRIGIFDDTVAPEGLSFQDGQFTNGVISLDLNRLSQDEVASSIKRIVYLQIPITLNYKLNKRIDLSSGLNFSYLINASAEGKLIDNLNPDAELKDYVFSTSELLSANLLSRWDNQITAGLKVKFGKSLRLNAEYRYGLKHIIKSNGVDRGNQSNNGGIKDFNRTIFLGLNYTFPQKGSK